MLFLLGYMVLLLAFLEHGPFVGATDGHRLNLNKILAPCVNKKCFVLVQSFDPVDIAEPDVPIILRLVTPKRYRGPLIESSNQYQRKVSFWSPPNIWPNISVPMDFEEQGKNYYAFKCNSSKYLSNAQFFIDHIKSFDYCTNIKLNEFSGASRLWFARIQIDIEMPPSITDARWKDLLYPYALYYEARYYTHLVMGSLNPIASVLITRSQSRSKIFAWILGSNGYDTRKMLPDLPGTILCNFLIVQTNEQMKLKRMYIAGPNNKLHMYSEKAITWNEWAAYNVYAELQLVNKQHGDPNIHIINELGGRAQKNKDGVLIGLRRCSNSYTHSDRSIAWATAGIRDTEKRLSEAYTHMVLLIFRNVTYSPTSNTLCKDGKIISNQAPFTRKPIIGTEILLTLYKDFERPLVSQMVFNNSLGNLRFIVCYNKGTKALPVNEFFSVFEHPVWMWMGITLAFCVLSMKISDCMTGVTATAINTCGHITSLLKVLVEQGNPFLDSLMERTSLKWLTIAVLITGTVLSNGYKNTNVYNMILERNRETYEAFSEIEDGNFSLYFRVGTASYYFNKSMIAAFQLRHHKIPYTEKEALAAISELDWSGGKKHVVRAFDLATTYKFGFRILADTEVTSLIADYKLNKVARKLWNLMPKSSFHPKTLDVLVSPLLQLIRQERHAEEFGDPTMEDAFHDAQYEMIYSVLSECKKQAFLLPEWYAFNLQADLFKNKNAIADVGKDLLSKTIIGTNFVGFVSIPMLKRIPRLIQSGIPDWWRRYLSRTKLSFEELKGDDPKPASIKGNTLVVFLLWTIGTSTGIVLFGLEELPRVTAILVKFVLNQWLKYKVTNTRVCQILVASHQQD